MAVMENESAERANSGESIEPTVLGAAIGDVGDIDVQTLDEETQRFVLETHIENLGLLDFLGYELATLALQSSDYSKLPDVGSGQPVRRRGHAKMGDVTATTIKSFVGMGILTLPYATTKGGYILGPLFLLLVAWLSHHCMGLLLKLTSNPNIKAVSFGALGMKVAGRWAKVLVESCLILTQYGFAIADLIFIVENVKDVVCVETKHHACPDKTSICIGVLVFLLPLTWLRSLQVLTVPVLLSNVVLLGGISWVYYCAFAQVASAGVAPDIVAFNWKDMPVFFGCAVFSFEGIGLVLPIQSAMQNPSHFPAILRQAMIILGVIFSTFMFLGYVAYGPDTRDMIVFNIPQNKITSFLRLFYCLGVFFTYPVMMFPLYAVTESKIRCLKDTTKCWRSILFRSILVILTGVIGMNIPHFGLFLGFIGSFACSLLAFVLPALFHLIRPDRPQGVAMEDAKDVGIIAFG
eukprot:CAMPEP_0168417734 /NCGR_PEP_ID=MMETSP0228-20121227/31408_1 /TAXON_ID=133427 /ORGANISM="Protoceratium reticulatum, Strain CCCM 535 (=CCMP 1889)" /LENGTH=463 /DNA_ID=CAMNT_0008431599 /DNA_START=98 /DNA_END=1485 /DNA_ORIENTATION=-